MQQGKPPRGEVGVQARLDSLFERYLVPAIGGRDGVPPQDTVADRGIPRSDHAAQTFGSMRLLLIGGRGRRNWLPEDSTQVCHLPTSASLFSAVPGPAARRRRTRQPQMRAIRIVA